MNTTIYKQVNTLAESLMEAVEQEDQANFDKDYAQLLQICEEHEGTDKDHPAQWEALADFTGELDLAIAIYDKALIKAEAIDSIDFCSSIGFSIGAMKLELDDKKGAIESLEKAKVACEDIEDKELKAEIHNLLTELTAARRSVH
ncbi:MAG: tetratricopeptide repeat protein [Oleispira sp.]|nr:tetratricopeptide repeat protein [Oleispira sp.]